MHSIPFDNFLYKNYSNFYKFVFYDFALLFLELHKLILNCTFCVELHVKKNSAELCQNCAISQFSMTASVRRKMASIEVLFHMANTTDLTETERYYCMISTS